MILVILSLVILPPGLIANASDEHTFTGHPLPEVTETAGTESNAYFRLVETRIIDAQPLDDQMLVSVSPALVAPQVKKISPLNYNQQKLAQYHNSICFERCHSRNDFYPSDYTYQQWCRLIEKDGHSIFCKIPWDNSDTKNQIFKYLVNNAKNASPDSEGIGVWNYPNDSFLADVNRTAK